MITILEGLPEGVLGASASGEVTAEDYRDTLVPAIEKALEGRAKLHFLYQIGPGFESLRPDAVWQDAKLGAGHMRAFERVAVVTDVDWIRRSIHGFAWLIPGEVKVYANADFDEAVSWLGNE